MERPRRIIPDSLERFALSAVHLARYSHDKRVERAFRELDPQEYPENVLLILDGNRRYARRMGFKDIVEGHRAGADTGENLLRLFAKMGIDSTLWVFSIDNWNRPEEERGNLFRLLDERVRKLAPELRDQGFQFVHIGRREALIGPWGQILIPALPDFLLETFDYAQDITRCNRGRPRVVFAANYQGADEITRIEDKFQRAKQAGLLPQNMPFIQELYPRFADDATTYKPIELSIRTSGEDRTSGFGWRIDHAQLYNIQALLPETKPSHFQEAFVKFARAERRRGR